MEEKDCRRNLPIVFFLVIIFLYQKGDNVFSWCEAFKERKREHRTQKIKAKQRLGDNNNILLNTAY